MKRNQAQQQPAIMDRVVILEHQGHTAEILPVQEIDHERVVAPGHVIPTKDLKTYITPRGRLFVLHAPEWYIDETKHLASVEMATVIRQAVNYQRPGAASKQQPKWMIILPWILMALFALLWVVKK